MQWLNPKAWLASVAGISAFTEGGDSTLLWLFAGLYLPICWLSLASWVCEGRSWWLPQSKSARPVRMALA